jgi:hypothetical protein
LGSLAGRLGRSILVSAAFARHCMGGLAPLGDFHLPGIDAAQRVFGLADEA